MTDSAVTCAGCGSKVRSTRTRCPRCRAFLPQAKPAVLAARGPGAKIAGVAVALAAVSMVTFQVMQREPQALAPTARPKDPFAARRASVPSPVNQGQEVPPPDPAFQLPSQLASAFEREASGPEALDRLRSAVEAAPQDPQAIYDVGRALVRLGRIEEALSPLRRAAELGTDRPEFSLAYAYACARRGQWPDAVAAFRRASALEPNDPTISYDLALALQKLGDYNAAAREYSAAVSLSPAVPLPRLGLAISLDRLGSRSDAVAAYQECVRLMPPGADADRVRARILQLGG